MKHFDVEEPVAQTTHQHAIAWYFYELGSWRRHRPRGYPTGEPASSQDYGASADMFDRFATFILTLPADDFRLRLLWSLASQTGDESLSPGPYLSAAIAHLQPGEVGDLAVFLNYLVQAAVDDAIASDKHPVTTLLSGLTDHTVLEGNDGAL